MPGLRPDGFPAGAARSYEGLLIVPREGWQFAMLDTKALLAKNRAQRNLGRQTVEPICLFDAGDVPEFRRALARAMMRRSGVRLLWVRFQAEPRLASGPCMDRAATRPRERRWGRYLRVIAVTSADPR